MSEFELPKVDLQLIWASHAGFGPIWVSWASQNGAWVTKWSKFHFRHEFMMKFDKDWVGLNFGFRASQARFRPIWASEGGFGSIWASQAGFSAI